MKTVPRASRHSSAATTATTEGSAVTAATLDRLETYPLQVAFWLTVVLGGLALVLTVSGLFSVLSYLVAQRTKEIGVRIALGATTGRVA